MLIAATQRGVRKHTVLNGLEIVALPSEFRENHVNQVRINILFIRFLLNTSLFQPIFNAIVQNN